MDNRAPPTPVGRYLDLMESVLINSIYQDEAMDPWSPPVYDEQRRDTGRDWPRQAMTMIGRKRLHSLRECCEIVLDRGVPGDFAETGVWRGGACIMMTAVLAAHGVTDRTVWGFDSFEGLPPPDAAYPADTQDPHHRFPQLAVGMEDVIENFRRTGLLTDRLRLVKGWFRDTLAVAPVEKLAVLRLDGDMYESTILSLEALYPRLQVGGICIIDDYGCVPGCRAAVDGYRHSRRITAPLVNIDNLGVWWKKA
jgi:O-methyltransferase